MNIIAEKWQILNLPKTNMLDLGVRISLQSIVEKTHKGKVMQTDTPAKSVIGAFEQITSAVLDKVHSRWRLVLQLLVSGKCTNEVVEEHCSLKKKAMLLDLPDIPDFKQANGYVSSDGEESDVNSDGEHSII